MEYDALNYVGNDVTLENLLETADWPDQLKENIDIINRYNDRPFEDLTLGQMKELFSARLEVEREWVKRYPLNKNHRSDTLFKEYLLLKLLESYSSSQDELFSKSGIHDVFIIVSRFLDEIISKEYYDMDYITANRSNFAKLHGHPFYKEGLPEEKQSQKINLIHYLNSMTETPKTNLTLQNKKDCYMARLALAQLHHSVSPLSKSSSLFSICENELILKILDSSKDDGSTLFINSDIYNLFTKIIDISGGIMNENILFHH